MAPPDAKREASPDTRADLPKAKLAFHLGALRRCLLISLIAVGAVFLAVFFGFARQLMDILELPLRSRGIEPVFITLYEPIVIQMKASFIAAVVVASPVIIAQIWLFLKPALYPQEGRAVVMLFLISLFLFLAGTAFAAFIVIKMAINFFLLSGEGIAAPFISIEKYVGFLFSFVLPFGVIFELPVVMGLLTRAGIAGPVFFAKTRRYVILLIFVIAAILTPPDVLSQMLLAVPLLVLFEAGIIVSRILEKKHH
jgi:sec-independent protein translocase protein TatC